MAAGAFRRPGPPGAGAVNNVAGVGSGYGVSSLGSPRYGGGAEGGPSQADAIREQYLREQARAMGGEGQEAADVTGAGVGVGAGAPRFDVSLGV